MVADARGRTNKRRTRFPAHRPNTSDFSTCPISHSRGPIIPPTSPATPPTTNGTPSPVLNGMISHPGGVKERIAHPIESSVKHWKIAMRSTTATVPHPPRTRMPATPRRTPRSKVRIALYKNRNGLVNSPNNALINLKLSHLSALFREAYSLRLGHENNRCC